MMFSVEVRRIEGPWKILKHLSLVSPDPQNEINTMNNVYEEGTTRLTPKRSSLHIPFCGISCTNAGNFLL